MSDTLLIFAYGLACFVVGWYIGIIWKDWE